MVRAVLPSGLRLIVAENPKASLASVVLRVRAGSGSETPETNGHAHFLEHLVFKGSAARKPGDYDRRMEGLGGEFLARTTRDFTEFSATLPGAKVLEALPLFAELVLKPAFRGEDVEQERAVIARELAAAESETDRIGYRLLYGTAFDEGHPYRLPLMGSMETLAKVTQESLRTFWQARYRADRMTLVVTGKVSAADVRRAAESLFPVPPASPEPAPEVRTSAPAGRILRADDLPPEQQPRRDLTTVFFAFRLPPADVEMVPLMDALVPYVGNGRSGRVGRRLVETDKLALTVASEFLPGAKDSLFLVTVTATPGNAARLERAFEAEIRRMREDMITDEEAETARAAALSKWRYAQETVEGRARQLAHWDQYAPGLNDDVYRVKMLRLNKSDLQIATRRFLTPLSFTVATVGPRVAPAENSVAEGGQP